MSFLSNLLKDVAPVVATVAPFAGPTGQAVAAVASAKVAADQRAAARYQQALQKESMMENFGNFGVPRQGAVVVPPYNPPVATASAGGGFFSGVSDFFRSAGGVVRDAFGSGIPQLLGVGRPQGVAQQPAVTSVTNVGAQESQGSGTIQAGFGSSLLPLAQRGLQALKSPAGQVGFGTAVGSALSMLGSDGRPMRVTRKMKTQLKNLLNQTNNNYTLVGDFLGLSLEQMLFILNKRFRNDGPVITKAALRKTRSTIRKMKNMCDMYDDLRPAARRRTPMKRARSSTTLIKN